MEQKLERNSSYHGKRTPAQSPARVKLSAQWVPSNAATQTSYSKRSNVAKCVRFSGGKPSPSPFLATDSPYRPRYRFHFSSVTSNVNRTVDLASNATGSDGPRERKSTLPPTTSAPMGTIASPAVPHISATGADQAAKSKPKPYFFDREILPVELPTFTAPVNPVDNNNVVFQEAANIAPAWFVPFTGLPVGQNHVNLGNDAQPGNFWHMSCGDPRVHAMSYIRPGQHVSGAAPFTCGNGADIYNQANLSFPPAAPTQAYGVNVNDVPQQVPMTAPAAPKPTLEAAPKPKPVTEEDKAALQNWNADIEAAHEAFTTPPDTPPSSPKEQPASLAGDHVKSHADAQYDLTFPHGSQKIATLPKNGMSGFRAIIHTMERMIPKEHCPRLKDLMAINGSKQWLHRAIDSDERLGTCWLDENGDAKLNDFTPDQLNGILGMWAEKKGLQETLQIGVDVEGKGRFLVPIPNTQNVVVIIWIHNFGARYDGEKGEIKGHYSGLEPLPQ